MPVYIGICILWKIFEKLKKNYEFSPAQLQFGTNASILAYGTRIFKLLS